MQQGSITTSPSERDRRADNHAGKVIGHVGSALGAEIFSGALWIVGMLSFWLVKTYVLK